jgi:hypothetical protein
VPFKGGTLLSKGVILIWVQTHGSLYQQDDTVGALLANKESNNHSKKNTS